MLKPAHSNTSKLAAIINMKGGVGKTTLSVNLAMELAGRGNRVLLIDLDPQANASLICMSDAEIKSHISNKKKSITGLFIQVFEPRVPLVSNKQQPIEINEFIFSVPLMGEVASGGKLDFIPSDLYLSSVLRGINLGPYSLDKLITDDVKNSYDYILVDCAPTYSSLTTIALNSCGAVMIPMIADSFGKHGTTLMKQILLEHKHDYGKDIKVIGVVFTMNKSGSTRRATEKEIIAKWGSDNVFHTSISENEWYRVANGERKPFSKSRAHSDAKAELAVFVDDFIKRISK